MQLQYKLYKLQRLFLNLVCKKINVSKEQDTCFICLQEITLNACMKFQKIHVILTNDTSAFTSFKPSKFKQWSV